MTKMVWSQGGHIKRRLLYMHICILLDVLKLLQAASSVAAGKQKVIFRFAFFSTAIVINFFNSDWTMPIEFAFVTTPVCYLFYLLSMLS